MRRRKQERVSTILNQEFAEASPDFYVSNPEPLSEASSSHPYLGESLVESLVGILLEKEGQAAGRIELAKVDLKKARDWAWGTWKNYDKDLDQEIPNFDENFKNAQSIAKRYGTEVRKDMPVIKDGPQVKHLQQRLKGGYIDVDKPFHDKTNPTDPFPEGLSGAQAKEWLTHGLKDGSKPDDVIKATKEKIPAGRLKPIQRQIYVDKALSLTPKFGVKNSVNFLKKSLTIVSKDNFIIDGHHRWLQASLIDPSIPFTVIKIDMPIDELVDMTKAYGDALGNPRNK